MAKFPIDITARDKTGDVISKVGNAFEKLSKGSGFEKLGKGFDQWAKSGRSIGEAWKAIGSLGDKSAEAAGGLGEAAEGAGALGLAVGVAVLGIGALAIGFEKAAESGTQFSAKFAEAGRSLEINAGLIGTSTRELQRWQGAARLAGLSADDASSALMGIGAAFHDADIGRNKNLLPDLANLHVHIRRLKDGSVDTTAALLDLSKAFQTFRDPQTQRRVAGEMGVASLLPLLQQGPDAIRKYMAEVDASGAELSDHQKAQAAQMNHSLAQLGLAWEGLKNSFAEKLIVPWIQPLVDGLSSALDLVNSLISAKTRFDKVFGLVTGDLLSGKLADLGSRFGAAAVSGGFGPPLASPVPAGGQGAGVGSPGGAPPNPAAAARFGLSVAGQFARTYLAQHGIRSDIALGVGAGITAEGGTATAFNPAGGGQGAFGLGQWRGSRLAALRAQFGPMPSLSDQMAFMLSELRGGDRGGASVLAANSPQEALGAYIRDFMRPGGGTAGDMRRGNEALAQDSKLQVDINLHGAPPGTVAKTAGTPNVSPTVRIGQSFGELGAMASR